MFKLSAKVKRFIIEKVENLFDTIKTGVLGLDKKHSLLFNIYMDAYQSAGGLSFPDPEEIEVITNTSSKYLDVLKLKTSNSIINAGESAAESKLEDAIQSEFEKAHQHLDMIVATQSQAFQNLGAINGIQDSAGRSNDDEPYVYWIGPSDNVTCKDCLEMYFLEDRVTPRVWKVSELSTGFFNRKHECPSVLPIHPRCRHSPIYLRKGHGFKDGKLKFISNDHDEYEEQK